MPSYKKETHMHRILTTLLTVALLLSFATPSFAQNTGGIFGPVVNEGHKSWQYRATIDPDNAAGDVGFAQRLHYQQAINDDFMWRIVGQTRKTAASDLDLDFVQAELFWQITPDEQNYQTGLRFDGTLRNDNRPEQLSLHWINQWRFGQGWQARVIATGGAQLGENSTDGVFLQSRSHIQKSIDGGKAVGVEMFNNLGSTDNLGSFKDQSHSFGPYVTAPIGNNFSIFAGALFGLSEAAPDNELRLWLTKTL